MHEKSLSWQRGAAAYCRGVGCSEEPWKEGAKLEKLRLILVRFRA
jgi:hypothetical protein